MNTSLVIITSDKIIGIGTTTNSGIAKQVGFVERPDNSIGQYARGYFTFPASTFGND